MPKFVIERSLPGAGSLSAAELQAISQKSVEVLDSMAGRAQWLQSYVTDDKLYCVYIADDAATVAEHAEAGAFPCDTANRVRSIIDPTTAELTGAHPATRRQAMDRDQLRAVQKPLKQQYRDEPTAALITLHAAGSLDLTDVACSVQTGRALVEAGLHPATGGDGSFACSGDMLLQALVACAGVTLRSVATNRSIEVAGTIRVEGDLDFRGTLGVDPEAPVGFRSIRLFFELDSPAPAEVLDELIATTERYCVVLQTLTSGIGVSAVRA